MVKKISVIIVNYNGMPHLDICIPSILSQNYANFEVIFVDNKSTDSSLDYARHTFPNLTFVASDENVGYAGGINRGLVCARGDYIAPLNVDTEVSPEWLSHLAQFLDENPKVGAVMPKVLLFDDRTKINTTGANIHITGLGFCRELGKRDNKNLTKPIRVSGVSGCSYLIRREILDRIGGAPEECFMGNDDVVLSWTLNLMGYEMYCIPQSVVYHKYQLKMNPEKFFVLERNRYAMLLSTLKPLPFILTFPIFVAVELLMTGYCLVQGRTYLEAKLRALSSVWRDHSVTRQRRAHIQELRQLSDFELFRRLQLNLEWRQLFHILK